MTPHHGDVAMHIRYVGPFPEGVRLPMPGGREVIVAHSEVIEVSDPLGHSLLEQPDNWEQVAPAPAPPDKPAPKAVKKED